MAILLVKIEDEDSLALNEFYDYNGYCYATTASRKNSDSKVIDMSCFYEAAVNTEILHDVPVVFVTAGQHPFIIGWYEKAEICHEMWHPSLFLEGNVKAHSSHVVWLPKDSQTKSVSWFSKKRCYEVIEEEDSRYLFLQHMMQNHTGENQMLKYSMAPTYTVDSFMKNEVSCKESCEQWAELVITEKCRDICDLKTLEAYAKKYTELDRKNPDGYYYMALAAYHLGFVKAGLKQINKACKLEPNASDLIALKGMLLVSKGYAEEGAEQLKDAYDRSTFDSYLIMAGRAYLIAGKIDKAYECFTMVEEEILQEEIGIQLKEIERKWGAIKFGYRKIKDRFWKK